VFAALVEEGTLTCGPDARYGIAAAIAWRGRMPGLFDEGRTPKAS
jgi:hypothetical protein